MKVTIATLLAVLFFINQSNAQPFTFYQTNDAPKVIKPGTVSDTLLNPFAGGLNNPQFSNIDWNRDGKQDLFVFDKETRRPIAYVYNSTLNKMVHAPQYEGGFKMYFNDWAFLRDYNFDGKPDLVISASANNKITTYPNPIESSNIQLFVNRSGGNDKMIFNQYSNLVIDTGMYVGEPYNQQMPPSWLAAQGAAIPGIDDMDGDGDFDILTNVGYLTTFSYYENLAKNKQNATFPKDTFICITRDKCWGFASFDFNKNKMLIGLEREKNSSECVYNMWSGKVASKHIEQSVTLVDLNGDGIKDVIFNDALYKNFTALYNGRLQAKGRYDSIVAVDTLFLTKDGKVREFLTYPSAYYVDIDADGKNELLVTATANQAEKTKNNIWVFDAPRVNGKLVFNERSRTDFLYNDQLDHGLKAVPFMNDIDADGDLDLLVSTSGEPSLTGNNHDFIVCYKNIGSDGNPIYQLFDSNYASISSLGSTGFFAAHPTMGDLNDDGYSDLIIGEGNGNISYIRNNQGQGFELISRNAFGILNGTYATPQLIDLNKDGLLDIICGQTNGTVSYYQNIGTLNTPKFSSIPTIDSLGRICTRENRPNLGYGTTIDYFGYSAPHILDIDNDGVWDLVSGSYSGQLWVYKGIYANKDSVAKRVLNPFNDYSQDNNSNYNKRFGLRNTVTSAKLNSDSFPDLIVGTLSGGLIYLSTRPNPANGVADFEVNNKAIEVFPNPTSSSFNIKFNEVLPSDAKYILVDLMGRKVKEGEINRVNLQPTIETDNIPAGLYLFQLQTLKWQATQRIVITK